MRIDKGDEDFKGKISESEEESSYYDDEDEVSGEEGEEESKTEAEPKTQEIIDVTGNMSEDKIAEMEAQNIFAAAKKRDADQTKFDSSELIKKMKDEWM